MLEKKKRESVWKGQNGGKLLRKSLKGSKGNQ